MEMGVPSREQGCPFLFSVKRMTAASGRQIGAKRELVAVDLDEIA
jgi:hypothetical protein